MRRFNYTGRKRIPREGVQLRVSGNATDAELEVGLNPEIISELAGGQECLLVLELRNQAKYERIVLGEPPEIRSTRVTLERFSVGEHFRARVMLVSTGKPAGRIVAMANGLAPTGGPSATEGSLLPVSLEKLDGLVYKVDFTESGPILCLNSELDSALDEGIKSYASTSVFASLVLPEAYRQILTYILLVERYTADDEDLPEWARIWLDFAKQTSGEQPPDEVPSEDTGPVRAWVDLAVTGLAARSNFLRRFEQAFPERS